jgi:hypothetical protein
MVYAATNQSASVEGLENHSHKDLLQQYAGHMTKEDVAYFLKWDHLIDLEAHSQSTSITECWLTPADELERNASSTLSAMVFDINKSTNEHSAIDGDSAVAVFRRQTGKDSSMRLTQWERGTVVIVSTDDTTIPLSGANHPKERRIAHILRGSIERTDSLHIFLRASSHDFRRLLKIASKGMPSQERLLRIDKCDTATGASILRQNLVRLFAMGSDLTDRIRIQQLEWLRDVVVRLKVPDFSSANLEKVFSPVHPQPSIIPGCNLKALEQEFMNLNSDQKAAVLKVRALNSSIFGQNANVTPLILLACRFRSCQRRTIP